MTARTAFSNLKRPGRILWPGVVVMAGLAGCANLSPPAPVTIPVPPAPVGLQHSARPLPRPDTVLTPPAPTLAEIRLARAERAALIVAPTPASSASASYFATVQANLLQRGLLRTQTDPEDVSFTAGDLARNFILVALHDEYTRVGDALIAQATPAPLRRWAAPVRLQLEFGNSVPTGRRIADRTAIQGYAARLQQASGHSVSVVPDNGNMHVLILSEDERRAIAPRLRELIPGIPDNDVSALTELSSQTYCTVFAYSRDSSPVYVQAVALIRAELPERLRLSCIHEELAQGMGLANDDPKVRPSIFNDDEEFAYLTRHDELLLKMLYDPRMTPGMDIEQATPVADEIARELLPAPAH